MSYLVLTVCTGNICRSPLAEFLLRERFAAEGLAAQVRVASCGTTGWEEGEPIDPRARALLDAHGISSREHRARRMTRRSLQDADLILAMDHDHLQPIRDEADGTIAERLHLMRSFDPEVGADAGIRDPWYGDERDFETCFAQIDAAADGVVQHVREQLASRRH